MVKNLNNDKLHGLWAVVPAAGAGLRMGGDIPKQYLPLAGKTVLEKTLEKLLAVEAVSTIVVALSEQDEYWEASAMSRHPRIQRCMGGSERSDSVLNALQHISAQVSTEQSPWVMVHDGARPCVTVERIQALAEQAWSRGCGAILAAPVTDTVKQVAIDQHIDATRDRSSLWLAHTPQMFPLRQLKAALQYCREHNIAITDEAAAVEAFGGKACVVSDRRDNIKVTMPEDLAWAEFILENQTICE